MGKSGDPLVTIFIPAYNAVSYISQAMESVLDQSFEDFELLVIDDASTDETAAVVSSYLSDPRVRLIRHAVNQQRPATRTEGVREARGEYIALLDADDLCGPTRLTRQLAFLQRHREIDVVGSWWSRIDADDAPLPVKTSRRYLAPGAIDAYLLFRCVIHNPTIMARTAVLRAYRYDPAFPIAEDYEIWARMLGHHRFAVMPEELMAYREHADQVSTAQAADSLYFRQRVQARLFDRLGMVYEERDLVYHSLLYTGRRLFEQATGETMGLGYVLWAQRWLDSLLRANARQKLVAQAPLQRVTARLWWSLCQKAARDQPVAVWRVFLGSRLARQLPKARLVDAWLALRAGDGS